MTPESYFKINELWNIDKLKQHCEHNAVWVSESERFPGLVLLKYKDECQYDNLWTTFSRFSRGLVVDVKNQVILSHGFDKFFNLGQMPETNYAILKDQKEFEISEKLDGSCLISFLNPNDNQFYLTTTGSFDSEHGKEGTFLFKKLTVGMSRNQVQADKILEYASKGTLIFELIDSRFRIVIDYKKKNYAEGLYLIGYRTWEGKLLTYAEVASLAMELGLPCVKTYQFESLDHLIETSKNLGILDEGFVLRWEPELLIKIKGPKYLELHRFISNLSDRNILQAVGNNTFNDLKSVCPEEYKDEVLAKIDYFEKRVVNLQEECYSRYADAPKDSRKEFAMWTNKNVEKYLRGFLFQLFDKKDLNRKHICKVIEEIEHVTGVTKI
jgi:RNA ligase